MSREQAMILRAQPQILGAQIKALIRDEVTKGCSALLSEMPVALEPAFEPVGAWRDASDSVRRSPFREETWPAAGDIVRMRVWISPNEKHHWQQSERLLKQLSGAERTFGFEIAGNSAGIESTLLCRRSEVPLLNTAFCAQFPTCGLSSGAHSALERVASAQWWTLAFRDYYPLPPYTHLLTCFEELQTSPLQPLLVALSQLTPGSVGFYQCLFQPARRDHNWHFNVETLTDLEYQSRLAGNSGMSQKYLQQSPSGDLHHMSQDVISKAHNDKPFFFVAVRVGVVGPDDAELALGGMASFMNLYQHGGRPLEWLSRSDYESRAPAVPLPRTLLRGVTHRPGFLVNSRELTSLVHLFPADRLESGFLQIPFPTLETLPVRNQTLAAGTHIGNCEVAGVRHRVCIPDSIRALSTHLVASPGVGKSTLMTRIALQDIDAGGGCVFIDAHGDTIDDLIRVTPQRHVSRCIYFNPGDPDWIPLWNPLAVARGTDIHRLADDILACFKHVFNDWGDRLAHVLRNGLIGLLGLPSTCLADLYNLTRQRSEESERLRERILKTTPDNEVRSFWEHDFLNDYRPAELQSPRHKISQLTKSGLGPKLMFSQPANRIDLGQIMDEGRILLVDLSLLGQNARQLLGGLLLTLLLTAALARRDRTRRRPFSVFVDEAHLFVSVDAVEHIIVQTRKFGVNLCLAHHYLRQFGSAKVDALSMVGTTILGRLDKRDSKYFMKDLRDMVDVEEIIRLPDHEMIARIGDEVVRIKTLPLPDPPASDTGHEIIRQSRLRYCRKAEQIVHEQAVTEGDTGHGRPSSPFQYDVEL